MNKINYLTCFLMLVWCGASAVAQTKFPDKPLRLIVPFAPGGGVDAAARLMAKQLHASLAVPVVVDNRPGANGTIGGKVVQTASADGYTLLFSAATHIVTKLVTANPPYDPVTDFEAVARVGEAPLLMVIAPNLAARKLTEVIEAARQQPDKWTAGIPALGAPSHLATLLVARQGNLKLTTVSYKGTAPALADVAGGHIQMLIDSIVSLMPMAKGGRVRPIVTTAAKRSGVMPEVPTAVESGFPGLVYGSWYGLWAPKGTPEERVRFLNKAANDAVLEQVKSGSFAALGIEPVTESSVQFRKIIAAETGQNAELLKSAGFKAE